MQLSTWRTAFPAGEGNHKTVTMSAHTRTSIYARFTQVLKEAGYRRKTLISTGTKTWALHCHIGCTPHSSHLQPGAGA